MSKSEEELFQEIVDNYGDRPPLTDWRQTMKDPAPRDSILDLPEEHFTPPTPPPFPHVTAKRFLSWGGILIAPLLALFGAMGLLTVPRWTVAVLVLWFVGSVVFLIAFLPRQAREGWDDGAQV